MQMSFTQEAIKAMNNPIRDMTQLSGGVGNKKLDALQIRKILAAQKAEQRTRREKAEQRALSAKVSNKE